MLLCVFLKLMKPHKCLGLADDSCCKFSYILPLQNLACSVVLCLFGKAIMPWFVPVKSLAYAKTTVHISVLKYWQRKSRGDNNAETLRI